jgi:hypothetical protein
MMTYDRHYPVIYDWAQRRMGAMLSFKQAPRETQNAALLGRRSEMIYDSLAQTVTTSTLSVPLLGCWTSCRAAALGEPELTGAASALWPLALTSRRAAARRGSSRLARTTPTPHPPPRGTPTSTTNEAPPNFHSTLPPPPRGPTLSPAVPLSPLAAIDKSPPSHTRAIRAEGGWRPRGLRLGNSWFPSAGLAAMKSARGIG